MKYMPLDYGEDLERYELGGYHPVAIGDQLHDRYLVVHKSGFGTYSTIWLARDQYKQKYVAIKIKVADAEDDTQECSSLHRLSDQVNNAHPGKAVIPPVLDEIIHIGPNGEHNCIVTVPAMTSLNRAKDCSVSRLFQSPVARAIAAQLIQAVAFLHSQGIVHADSLSPEELYNRYGSPRTEPIERLDSQPLSDAVPKYAVKAIRLGRASDLISLPEARVMLIDFGESFVPSITTRSYSNTPDELVPPEVFFSAQPSLSYPADIWTLGCTIWSILGSRPLFECINASIDEIITEHVDVLGKLPPEWWQTWEARSELFDEQGSREQDLSLHGGYDMSWNGHFEFSVQRPRREYAMDVVGDDEKAALFSMLRGMVTYRPEERLTAEQIMDSEWMTKWALPELEKIKVGR